jgi:hypothetical protein
MALTGTFQQIGWLCGKRRLTMLNTVMALWNQNPGAKRLRIVKVLLTILLITGSASLFLFTLNSSIWSPFAGAQGQHTIRKEQPTMSKAHGVVIAVNTPIGDVGTVSITPTATTSGLKVPKHGPCVQIPAVVVQPRTSAGYLNPASSGNNSLEKKRSGGRHVYPKVVRTKTGKRHSTTKPALKATITSISPISSAPVVPPVATPTTQIAIPTATAITIIVLPPDGTTVSNLPAIVNAGATPDVAVNSATQFTSNLRQKDVKDAVVPLDKSDNMRASIRENAVCSGNAT